MKSESGNTRTIRRSGAKLRVLFLCTANSARSQMAEALLRSRAGDRFVAFSAGTAPEPVDPRVRAVLQTFGIDSRGLSSKSVASLAHEHFDYVISLCSKAHEDCRHWPHSGVVMAWDFADPRVSKEPNAFANTLRELDGRIRLFVQVHSRETGSSSVNISPLQFYKCLADEVRLLSLLLIEREQELCVCELMEALQQPQPKVSRHLAQLRKCGLLLDRRNGQWVFYRLHPALEEWMYTVLRQTSEHNPHFTAEALSRLHAMESRPERCDAATVSTA